MQIIGPRSLMAAESGHAMAPDTRRAVFDSLRPMQNEQIRS
ncbi:hypothetical protein PARPLA_02760 [Rhodobacteraceae bacterium THAF1]|nr:hypothetical protein FIU81_05710 [Palleronia sp. THAF1]VDC28716.1 hypothetical protein PARPLA_02760 [Rhodobacteraceae bacterium THAF1]